MAVLKGLSHGIITRVLADPRVIPTRLDALEFQSQSKTDHCGGLDRVTAGCDELGVIE